MNILTKICVVVLLVLVLFSSGVFITEAVNPDNWRVLYQNQRERAEQAVTLALNAQLALRQEQLNRDAVSKELQTVRSNSDKQAGDLAKELAAAKTSIAEKDAKLSAADTNLTKALANQEMAMGQAKMLDGQLTTARKDLATARAEIQRQNEALNTTIGERDRLLVQNKSLDQTIQDQKEQLEQKNQPAAGTAGVTAAPPAAEVAIEGQITAVSGDSASVNIGSAKGLAKDMTLIIYRNSKTSGVELVGKLKLTFADMSSAGGIVTDRKLEVKQGDLVTTKVN